MNRGRATIVFATGLVLGAALGAAGHLVFSQAGRLDALEERVAGLEKAKAGAAARPAAGAVRLLPRAEVSVDGAPLRGAVDAPITVVEFSDFQCPFCARAHPTLKRLLDDYPGQVRLAFRHHPLPMHRNAPLAHRAALAAERQGRFWEMHDRIFESPRDLRSETLVAHAAALGLDVERFRRDLADPALDEILARDRAEAAALGITGTPAFFINGRRLSGAQPYQNFKTLIDRELAHLAAQG